MLVKNVHIIVVDSKYLYQIKNNSKNVMKNLADQENVIKKLQLLLNNLKILANNYKRLDKVSQEDGLKNDMEQVQTDFQEIGDGLLDHDYVMGNLIGLDDKSH